MRSPSPIPTDDSSQRQHRYNAEVAQWIYDKCEFVISNQVALQTDTGLEKLSMSAESWPGNVCREIMDWYPDSRDPEGGNS